LLGLAWKFMVPLALVNLGVAVLWRFAPEGLLRWLVCGGVWVLAYVALARGLAGARGLGPRVYHWAE